MNFLKASCKIRAVWFRLFGSFLRGRERLSLQEDEDQEEVTGSLLSGGAAGGGDDASNQEEQACPHLLPVSPVPHRLQSSLHSINLSVQQVGRETIMMLEQLISTSQTPVHLSVHLSVQGTLLGVCGSVGSGKTSLISSILGQVR